MGPKDEKDKITSSPRGEVRRSDEQMEALPSEKGGEEEESRCAMTAREREIKKKKTTTHTRTHTIRKSRESGMQQVMEFTRDEEDEEEGETEDGGWEEERIRRKQAEHSAIPSQRCW